MCSHILKYPIILGPHKNRSRSTGSALGWVLWMTSDCPTALHKHRQNIIKPNNEKEWVILKLLFLNNKRLWILVYCKWLYKFRRFSTIINSNPVGNPQGRLLFLQYDVKLFADTSRFYCELHRMPTGLFLCRTLLCSFL